MKTLEGQLEFLALRLEQAELPSKAGDIRFIIEADLVDDFKSLFKKKEDRKQKLALPLDVFDEKHLEDTRTHPKGSQHAELWEEDLIDEDPIWAKLEQGLRDFEKVS